MAIDSDDPVSLPTPPPPRPAARREAIDAALRKFDGIADEPFKRPASSWWAAHHRQLGAFATAAIIAVVSIPVALSVLQDQPKPAPQARAPAVAQPKPGPHVAAEIQAAPSAADEGAVAEVPRSKLPLEPHEQAAPIAFATEEQKAVNETRPAAAAPPVPPPSPPPPPPPAPAPERDETANAGASQDMIVTGSRIPEAEPSSQHGRLAAKRAADAASPISIVDVYGSFLRRLQGAVRSGSRRSLSGLIAFPLRVNRSDGPRIYRDRKAVEEDFDRIFTPRVRQAILSQRSDQLFVRDQGVMIGAGEVWFDQTCSNAGCSPPGPVKIKAVNP